MEDYPAKWGVEDAVIPEASCGYFYRADRIFHTPEAIEAFFVEHILARAHDSP